MIVPQLRSRLWLPTHALLCTVCDVDDHDMSAVPWTLLFLLLVYEVVPTSLLNIDR